MAMAACSTTGSFEVKSHGSSVRTIWEPRGAQGDDTLIERANRWMCALSRPLHGGLARLDSYQHLHFSEEDLPYHAIMVGTKSCVTKETKDQSYRLGPRSVTVIRSSKEACMYVQGVALLVRLTDE